MSIGLTITHYSDNVKISKKELTKILDCVSWKEPPRFIQPGRTAWHFFEEPPTLNDNIGCVLYTAKLKGVGIWNPQMPGTYSGVHTNTYLETPNKPTTEEYKYTARIPHVGFDEKGCFKTVYSSSSPYGGLTHERAVQEFANGLILYKSGIHSTIPLMVVEYEGQYTFQGKKMGAVISLAPVKFPYRAHNIMFLRNLEPEATKYWDEIRLSLRIQDSLDDEIARLKLLKIIGASFGKTLRGFAESGLYRHSGGLDNIFFCTQCHRAVLTDLDSSRNLNELASNVQALQVLRDIASVLYKFLYRLGHPDAINNYTIENLTKFNPLIDIIMGYFPESTELAAQQVSHRLLTYFVPYFFVLKKHQEMVQQDGLINIQEYIIDRNLFYVLCIKNLSSLFVGSKLASLYPYEHNDKEFMKNAQVFLGNQYEYLIYLLSQ